MIPAASAILVALVIPVACAILVALVILQVENLMGFCASVNPRFNIWQNPTFYGRNPKFY